MQGSDNFYGPISYKWIWLLFGLICVFLIVLMYFLIFFVTRKKVVKNLATLKQLPPKIINKDELKQKYLALISQAENEHAQGLSKSSVAHQQISLLTRLFFCELHNIHTDVMTLGDLKKSRFADLTSIIEQFYPNEFDMLEKGNVSESAANAKNLIGAQ